MVHRYFWPDVPTYGQMLKFIGAHLHGEGFDVSVFCGPPSYNGVYDGPSRPREETVSGIRVRRVTLPPDNKRSPMVRTISMLVFAARMVAHVVRRRADYDLITVTTIPPVVMGLAARVAKRLTGIPYVYHCLDLYPEAAEISARVRSRWLLKIARRMDTTTCRKAAVVVVLSKDMRATLERRGIDVSNVVVLNNFEVLEGAAEDANPVIPVDDGRFHVLFAGNMGNFQGLENLVEAAWQLAPDLPDVEFVFLGAGACLAALKEQAGALVDRSVRFVDHQPVAVAARAMMDCQLAVISLRPRIHEVSYPSKTMMYLRAGCRIAAVVEQHSDLATLIRGEDVGATCPPGDVEALVALIRQEVARGAETAARREATKAIGEEYFGRRAKLRDWTRLIAEIGDPGV